MIESHPSSLATQTAVRDRLVSMSIGGLAAGKN
jgi:hypothetical protein